MIENENHSLVRVICSDLLRTAKFPLILLAAVLFSAIFVLTVVHRTRLLTTEREQLALNKAALDDEWRNLILEENVLGDHSRIARIASENMHMQYVDLKKENIIIKQ